MELSVVLLVCTIVLCITQVLETPLGILGIQRHTCILLCAALLLMNCFSIPIWQEFILHPVSLALTLFLVIIAFRAPQKKILLSSLAALFTAGMALAVRLYLPISFEPGLWMGALCIGTALLLRRMPFSALYAAALMPLLHACLFGGYEYLTYGYTIIDLSAAEYFDAQIVGLLCTGMIVTFSEHRRAHA